MSHKTYFQKKKRMSHKTYAHITDKAMKKLCYWKGKVLTPARRKVLIQSAIPMYSMQSGSLPVYVCNQWMVVFFGVVLQIVHTTTWWAGTKFANLRQKGGRGCSASWRLPSELDYLWCASMRMKYLCNVSFRDNQYYRLRQLGKAKEVVLHGCKWKIGSSGQVKFWHV